MGSGDKFNRVDASCHLPKIILVWLVLSVLLGKIFLLMALPPKIILLTYSNYNPYVSNYYLLCSSVMFSLVLMPVACFFIWRNGFKKIQLAKNGSLIFSIMLILGVVVGSGSITLQGSNKFSEAIVKVLMGLDWLGAYLISFFGFFLFVSCAVIVLKNERSQ